MSDEQLSANTFSNPDTYAHLVKELNEIKATQLAILDIAALLLANSEHSDTAKALAEIRDRLIKRIADFDSKGNNDNLFSRSIVDIFP